MIDLCKDWVFLMANPVYDDKHTQMKREGKDLTRHKVPVDSDDMSHLYTSGALCCENPQCFTLE